MTEETFELTEDQVDRCRGEGFIHEPIEVSRRRNRIFFVCPWCGPGDHYALASDTSEAKLLHARPIHCYETGKMGWLTFGSHIERTIREEEEKFNNLLGKYKPGKPITAEQAVKRWHSEGIPLEVMEDDVDDPKRMHELAEQHRGTGKQGDQFGGVYA